VNYHFQAILVFSLCHVGLFGAKSENILTGRSWRVIIAGGLDRSMFLLNYGIIFRRTDIKD